MTVRRSKYVRMVRRNTPLPHSGMPEYSFDAKVGNLNVPTLADALEQPDIEPIRGDLDHIEPLVKLTIFFIAVLAVSLAWMALSSFAPAARIAMMVGAAGGSATTVWLMARTLHVYMNDEGPVVRLHIGGASIPHPLDPVCVLYEIAVLTTAIAVIAVVAQARL